MLAMWKSFLLRSEQRVCPRFCGVGVTVYHPRPNGIVPPLCWGWLRCSRFIFYFSGEPHIPEMLSAWPASTERSIGHNGLSAFIGTLICSKRKRAPPAIRPAGQLGRKREGWQRTPRCRSSPAWRGRLRTTEPHPKCRSFSKRGSLLLRRLRPQIAS